MSRVVDRIDFLSRNQDTLMGVPTGFTMLDRLLGGLQKSDLVILAARPAMGKTSFCLSIAQNAAKRHGTRVAFFSLEMSNDQLVQRLLAMETGIDSHRLRLGNIHEEEWPILLEAANMLANTHIFIDDTPAASVNDIRTKARRLYAEDGIDLIIIDYMQLMTGQSGGNGRNENRQQEISYISRSLKTLARELNVPVIALSQLSRAVESRSDKRPMLSDLRESGCLTGDTLVTLATGECQPIASLVGQQDFDVFALNTTTGQLEKSTVSRAFCTGTKPIYKLTTEQGRTIRATANHPFLTVDGWKRLDKLQNGEQIVGAVCNRTGFGGNPCGYKPHLRSTEQDVILSIEADGTEPVYDLTVPGNHNFVANDIIVHNSIEQDADVVLFIYREDYYIEDTDRQNIADILVTKHRHGATGTVSLYFRKELTQFRDLEIQRTELDY
jgi:replicative DNA helicase